MITQIQVEAELEGIIKRHFRNPETYQTKYVPFQRRIEIVRALIGETPDDAVWDLVKSLGSLHNEYAHSRFTETEAGRKKIQEITSAILCEIRTIRSDIAPAMLPTQFEIITQAHFMAQRFFREINEALDKQGFPKAII